MEREELWKVLPQRYPMLMVDDILSIEPGCAVTGYKKIAEDEIWMQGHFPGEPVFPGVLLIEHMAQVTLFLGKRPEGAGRDKPYLAKVDQVKFLIPVLPGMELYTEVRKLSTGAGFIKAEACVYIGKDRDKLAAKGKLTCYLGMDME